MALLDNGTVQHRLAHSGLIGRSPTCHLLLSSALVSSVHATVRWTGDGWELRDLSSRNGTFLEGKRMVAGERVRLREGSRLAFGDAREVWLVVDVAPPQPVARLGGGEGKQVVGEDGVLVVPGDPATEIFVYGDGSGGWKAEAEDREWTVENGAEVITSEGTWTLELPTVIAPTRDEGGLRVAGLDLVIRVSLDEEHIDMSAGCGSRSVILPHRAHSYLVLTLARARMSADPSLPESEKGWVYQDDLARRLGMPMMNFNMAIHRFRDQLRQAGFADADEAIERRRGAGQVRLAALGIEVVRL